MKARVVITGIGMVTPLGNNLGTTWAGLCAGRVRRTGDYTL